MCLKSIKNNYIKVKIIVIKASSKHHRSINEEISALVLPPKEWGGGGLKRTPLGGQGGT